MGKDHKLVRIKDIHLHKRLKHELLWEHDDVTIGEAYDLFAKFCLETGILNLTESQRQQIVTMIGERGWEILLEESKK